MDNLKKNLAYAKENISSFEKIQFHQMKFMFLIFKIKNTF